MIEPSIIIVSRIGVDGTSISTVRPLGTYTESPSLGIAYPPHVACSDHLSMYKKGFPAILALFPSEVMTNEFPESGAELRYPVVHTTYVEVWETYTHSTPSIMTETEDPKLVPTICIVSPPADEAN